MRKQPNQRQKMEFIENFENTYGLNSKKNVSQQNSLRNLTQRKSSNVSATPFIGQSNMRLDVLRDVREKFNATKTNGFSLGQMW